MQRVSHRPITKYLIAAKQARSSLYEDNTPVKEGYCEKVLYALHNMRIEERPMPRPEVVTGCIHLLSIMTGYYTLENTEQALQATEQDSATIKSAVMPKECQTWHEET